MARIKQLVLAAEEALNNHKPSNEEEALEVIEKYVTDNDLEITFLTPVIQQWLSE